MDIEERGPSAFAATPARRAAQASAAVALVAALLACSACTAVVPPEPVITKVTTAPPGEDPNCRDYTAQAVVDGTPRDIVGHACLQPDGGWKVTEGAPGDPSAYGSFYLPAPYPYVAAYPYPFGYDPWFLGPPIGLSFGTVFFFDRNHRFHHFPSHRRFASGRSHGHSDRGMGSHGFGHGRG